jgi:MFS family permease
MRGRVEIARTYRELLRNGPLTRLLLGEFVSSIGDWLYLVALVVLVYRETQDPVILGIVGAARMLPYVFLSIPAGVITDRFDRRLVLLVSDIARGVCMVALAWLVAIDGPLWSIAAVALLAACFSTFFYPAIGALLPSLARDEREFGPANSAFATLDNLAWVVGPAIAGLLLATGELAMAFVLNAVTFAVIAVVLWTLPRATAIRPARPVATPAEEAVEAADDAAADAGSAAPPHRLSLLGRIPPDVHAGAVTGVTLVSMAAWFAFGGVSILIVVIATDVFRGGDAATGYLNGAIGIGGTIGALVSGLLVLRPRLGRPLLAAAVAMGTATLVLGIAGGMVVAFVAVIVVSIGNLVLDVTGTTIFQRAVPDEYRGRFGGLTMTAQTSSEAAGTLVIPILASAVGLGWALGVAGALLAGVTVVAVGLIGTAADVAAGPYDDDLRRIARLPLFGGLSPARVEAALRRLDPVSVAAGEVVIRQGDPADRFYVICGGTLRVTKVEHGEVHVLRALGQDDVFGERGLIARAPRAATITAETDAFLFAMDGADFLELLVGQPAVADRMMALYEAAAEAHVHG